MVPFINTAVTRLGSLHASLRPSHYNQPKSYGPQTDLYKQCNIVANASNMKVIRGKIGVIGRCSSLADGAGDTTLTMDGVGSKLGSGLLRLSTQPGSYTPPALLPHSAPTKVCLVDGISAC